MCYQVSYCAREADDKLVGRGPLVGLRWGTMLTVHTALEAVLPAVVNKGKEA